MYTCGWRSVSEVSRNPAALFVPLLCKVEREAGLLIHPRSFEVFNYLTQQWQGREDANFLPGGYGQPVTRPVLSKNTLLCIINTILLRCDEIK